MREVCKKKLDLGVGTKCVKEYGLKMDVLTKSDKN
jgi:hypothetical protein